MDSYIYEKRGRKMLGMINHGEENEEGKKRQTNLILIVLSLRHFL